MSKQSILVADDDLNFARAVRTRLEAAGYTVVVAQDGYQAVEFAQKYRPDMMILDINMPAGDGFSAHDRICKMTELAHKPFVFVSGQTAEWLEQAAKDHGAWGFLRKPFESRELLKLIESCLPRPAQSA